MSRLFPDRLRIRVSPSEVSFVRESGRLRRKAAARGAVRCDPAFGAEPWQGALAALQAQKIDFRCAAEVVLSNHFVRYAVIPWSGALAGAAEEEAYVRHHFTKIHGERVKGWAVRASAAPAGAPRLASAVDAALLEAIRRAFPKGGKARLASVQPLLMASFNAWRGIVPSGGAWIVISESDRACVALQEKGAWRSVQNAREPWLPLLERERYRAQSGELPKLVLLGGAAAPSAPGMWQFREMAG